MALSSKLAVSHTRFASVALKKDNVCENEKIG